MGGKKKGKGKKGGDPTKGEGIFKALCTQCHSMAVRNLLIFSLIVQAQHWDQWLARLLRRKKDLAIRECFTNLSAALSGKGTLKWTDANLDKWLKSPADFAPGNSMAFVGVPSSKDRADVIAYLKS